MVVEAPGVRIGPRRLEEGLQPGPDLVGGGDVDDVRRIRSADRRHRIVLGLQRVDDGGDLGLTRRLGVDLGAVDVGGRLEVADRQCQPCALRDGAPAG